MTDAAGAFEPETWLNLRDPWLVAAFDGWNDAADAASGVVDHLIQEWDAEVFAELDPEDFYDFQAVRPVLNVSEGGQREISWPTPTIFLAQPPNLARDVLLVRAPEPNYRWQSFCSSIISLAHSAGVREFVTLGALLSDNPHTRPIATSAMTNDPQLMERLGMEQAKYSGPIGISTVLHDAATHAGFAAASVWAAVPHYLAEPPCPKATLSLLGALEDALAMALPQGLLPEFVRDWQKSADQLMAEDEDLASYVRSLEEERDAGELPEASGDAIAREFERYLRRPTDDN